MDDHNLNEEQFNKWKQLVEIMGEESGNVACTIVMDDPKKT